MIYWTDWGKEPKIERATMDGGNRSIVINLQNDSWPNGIALDVKSKLLDPKPKAFAFNLEEEKISLVIALAFIIDVTKNN